MNERIRKLAEDANLRHFINEDGSLTPELHYFAELIVRECAEVVSNQYSEDWGKWSNRMILEHFGVE
jgi:hypothetical protein